MSTDTPAQVVNALLLKWPAPVQSTRRLAWALARLAVENDPLAYALMSDEEADAIADKNSFLHEAHANHIIAALNKACTRGL